jgi:predicted RNA-binding Zn-ribbon protein involved in translation (DUF1610 family)
MTARESNYHLTCPDCGNIRWRSGRCPNCRVHLVGGWIKRTGWRDPSDRAWLFHRDGTAELYPPEEAQHQPPR